jgi:hypothetical protein
VVGGAVSWALACPAAEPSVSAPASAEPAPVDAPPPDEALGRGLYRTPSGATPNYWHTFGSLALGDGFRFNNPYRLATQLGKTSESVSRSAAYYDLGLGAVHGPAYGLAHGAVLHLSIAAQGIPQEVFSVSYLALARVGNGRTILSGRFGLPIILGPDLSGGLETAFAAAFMVRAGIGVQSELAFSLYYGAGTIEHSVSTIPVLSGQIGLFFDYEVFK